jgi:hypothetical protein
MEIIVETLTKRLDVVLIQDALAFLVEHRQCEASSVAGCMVENQPAQRLQKALNA